jgi:neutral/alkaline ceramidase-like enzyme
VAAQKGLRVGSGRALITPAPGAWMAGYPPKLADVEGFPANIRGYVGRKEPATGAHDPLWAKAVVLDDGQQRVGIVGIDTLIVLGEWTHNVRQEVASRSGIPPQNLLINTTHTHSGPDVFGLHSDRNEALEAQLARGVVAAVEAACAGLVDGAVGIGRGRVGEVAINRRDTAEEIDQELVVLRVDGPDGAPLAAAAKVACHPVVLDYRNLLYSADICAAMYTTVESVYPGAQCLYLNGCAGNINPAAFPFAERRNIYIDQTAENYPVYWGSFDEAARIGRILAYEALRVVEATPTRRDVPVGGAIQPVALPLKSLADRDLFVRFFGMPSHFAERALRASVLETEVQMLSIGDTAILALPGEPFVDLGMNIKQQLAERDVVVLGYSNDDVRYILPASAYQGDKYETFGTWLAPGAAEILEQAAVALAS